MRRFVKAFCCGEVPYSSVRSSYVPTTVTSYSMGSKVLASVFLSSPSRWIVSPTARSFSSASSVLTSASPSASGSSPSASAREPSSNSANLSPCRDAVKDMGSGSDVGWPAPPPPIVIIPLPPPRSAATGVRSSGRTTPVEAVKAASARCSDSPKARYWSASMVGMIIRTMPSVDSAIASSRTFSMSGTNVTSALNRSL